MLFNTYGFIFLFLPITLLVFFFIGKRGHHQIAVSWLVGASLFFYGWWNPAYLGLIIGSMLFNYAIGVSLTSINELVGKKWLLIAGVAANLGVLGYYKYANFFVDNLNLMAGTSFNLSTVILPLAISFFTFQQITYLIDAYKGETREYNFLHYCLFVTFFPQLIAGPIVHHREMLPQFARDALYTLRSRNLAIGATIFVIGLFKKGVLADGVAGYATPVFQAADAGAALTFFEAWFGTLAYSVQLYFDFSGYSDMAIGLARMFGVRLPLNFYSPYRSTSIIDFWRRWHMTLSRFLRDYLYFPLGGSRKGRVRRYVNLLTTMILGGLWHGAGWNFIIWGALHGFYLIVNHAWRSIFSGQAASSTGGRVFGWFMTYLAVVIAWVPFRAETLAGAKNIWVGMAGVNGITLPPILEIRLGEFANLLASHGVQFIGLFPHIQIDSRVSMVAWVIVLTVFAVALPNTQQFMLRYRPALEIYKGESMSTRWKWMQWRPTVFWAAYIAVLFTMGLLSLSQVSEFLYFQF